MNVFIKNGFLLLLMILLAPLLSAGEHPDWKKYFTENQVHGCVVVYDKKAEEYHTFNAARCDSSFLPASTYKLLNTLIGLETGVIEGPDFKLPWDGKKRFVDQWNRDHTVATAIKFSVVWWYQEVARRIGEERMQAYLDSTGYGNGNISGGIDRFWLDGSLRITPYEQIDFLRAVENYDVPFSRENVDFLKSIIVQNENTEDYIIRAKTGWATQGVNIGWYVGWVEKADNIWFFAVNVESEEAHDNFISSRKTIAHQVLRDLGVIE